jgi:hypothetical protein
MDAFWSGQIKSKEWLINALSTQFSGKDGPASVEIHGGWVGVLASMLFQSIIPVRNICSVDIDPTVEPVAVLMNKQEEIAGRFCAITTDMCNLISFVDIVINTSCEHITQPQYEQWLRNRNKDQLLVLQSNNYKIDEHVRTAESLDEFVEQSHIDVLWSGELELPLYTRWMVIGKKYE